MEIRKGKKVQVRSAAGRGGNKLKLKVRIRREPFRLPPKLFELTVWNTSRCDLACVYCFVYRLYKVIGDRMNKETADALFHFAQHHLDPNGTIWFFGGEPTIDIPSMHYIVDRALANNIASRFGLTTNATLMNEDLVKWMAKRNFSFLISMDGTKELHDRTRIYPDGRGSWDDAWRGLQLVRRYANPYPQIRWTVPIDIDYMRKVPEAFKWMLKQGLTNIALDYAYEYEIDEDQLAAAKQMMSELAKIYDALYSQGRFIHSMMVRDAFHAITAKRRVDWRHRCGLAQGGIGIAPNGNLYPCHRYVASQGFNVGNVWEGFNENRLRINEEWIKYPPYSQDPELCKDCPFKKACLGGCLAMNYDLFGNMHVVPRTMCLLKRATVEVFRPLILKHYQLIARHIGSSRC